MRAYRKKDIFTTEYTEHTEVIQNPAYVIFFRVFRVFRGLMLTCLVPVMPGLGV